MAIDMTTVKKIVKPGNIYVKRIYLTNSAVVYKGTSTPCPVEITLFSKTTDTPTITASNFYDVLGECGYTMTSNSRYYLRVDNPYEFIYNNGTYDCVYASFQSQSATYPIVVWFSVPGATSVNVYQNWTITEEPWFDIGYMPTYDYEYKSYINSTAGSYTNFTVGKDEYGIEQIANYCINGVSYPEVTIVSVSGDTYTLSNQEVITISADHSSIIESGKKVREIFDGNGNRLWSAIKTGTYTTTVTRYSSATVETKTDTTLKSEISASIGVPVSNITLGKKTYTLQYYRARASRMFVTLRKYTTAASDILYQTEDTTTGLQTATFTTYLDMDTIRGYAGTSNPAGTQFTTTYAYFRSGDTYEVTVEYEYIL